MFTLFRYSREAAAKGFDMKPRFFLSSFSVSFLTLSLLLTSSVTAGRTGEEKEEKKTSTPFRPASARDERWRVNQRHSAAPTTAAAAAPRANQRREGQPPRPSSAISLRRAYASQQTALPETNVQEGFVKFRSTQEHINNNNNNRNSNNLRNDPPAAAAAAAARPRPQSAPGAAAADQGNVAKRKKSRQVFVRRNWVADNGALNINKDKSLNLTSSASKYSYQARCPIDVQGFERVRVSLRFEVTEGNFRFALINKDGERIIQNGELMDFILPHKLPRHPRVWFEFEPKGDNKIQFVITNHQAPRPSKMKIEGLTVEVLEDKPKEKEKFMTSSHFFSKGPEEITRMILLMIPLAEGQALSVVCKQWCKFLHSQRYVEQALKMLGAEINQFRSEGKFNLERLYRGFKNAAKYQRWAAIKDWKPSKRELRSPSSHPILEIGSSLGIREAYLRRIICIAEGWYSYQKDSRVAREWMDKLANNDIRYYQEVFIFHRMDGYEHGWYGYDKNPAKASALNDSLADNEGPYQWKAIDRRIRGYAEGKFGYPHEPAIARALVENLAGNPGPFQGKALGLKMEGYAEGTYGYLVNPDKVRECIEDLSSSE
jgi:hypothetical protein